MKRAGAVLLALLFLSALPAAVCAVTPGTGILFPGGKAGSGIALGSPVTLNAESLSYDEDAGVAVAEGNVEIGFGNRAIRADRIRYDSRSGEAELIGKVRYKDAGDEFSFDRIVLNIETERGILYNGSIRLSSNNYLISSDKFEKIGERTFRVVKASITTCPCDPVPDWKFETRRSEVTLDGYAIGRDVTFKVRDVPVLWLPWAAFPVKLTRQSGFLVPGFEGSGSKGFSVAVPYFWAISRWSDATFTLEEMTKRGLRPEAEYRFVLNRDSEGIAKATAFRDRKFGRDRYRIDGSNVYRGGNRVTANAKWDLSSDDQYYQDMVELDILRTARHVPSRGFVGQDREGHSRALSFAWINDVQKTPDDNTVQRLPELTATLLPYAVGGSGIEVSGDIAATYFYRKGGDRELRGRGYSEVSRTIPLYPSVTATPFLSLDVLGSDTVSGGDGARSGGRIVPGGGARIDAGIRRDFDRPGRKRLIHILRPEAAFRWIPPVDQGDIPLTDQWARIGSQRQFTFSLDQRLLRLEDGGPVELAFLSVEWAIDAGGGRKVGESPYLDPLSPYVRTLRDQIDLGSGGIVRERTGASDILARFRVRTAPRWSLNGETLLGVESHEVTMAALGVEWKRDKENGVLLEYRISRGLSEDVHGVLAVRPWRLLGFHGNANYSLRNGKLTDGSATVTVYPRSDCWSIGFVANRKTNPDENSYRLIFTLKGIGTLGS